MATYMHPRDLLQFARTSHTYRSIIFSRTFRSVWRTILRTIPDLPKCPDDMSEPQYVALIFDTYCFASIRHSMRPPYCTDSILSVLRETRGIFRGLRAEGSILWGMLQEEVCLYRGQHDSNNSQSAVA